MNIYTSKPNSAKKVTSMNDKKIIPIFYACDDAFVKFTIVSLTSLLENASKDFFYDVHVLITNVSDEMREKTKALECDNVKISFNDTSAYLDLMKSKLPLRDYYSKTTYYRFFIAEMFPAYDKAIYIDSDTIVLGDVSELYSHDLGDNLVGACHEQAMVQVDGYGTYVEKVVGVDRNSFFNAGIMLINCEQFRKCKVLERFIDLLQIYNFVVTQDEDYLNVICKDRVLWLDQRWNTEMFGEIPYPVEEFKIIHYIMVSKPWHYADCRHGDIFWKYAKMTSVYEDILAILEGYTAQEKERDQISADRLLQTAIHESHRDDTFVARQKKLNCNDDRKQILERIEQYELEGRFDEDVENDPVGRTIMPGEVDYTQKKLTTKLAARIAFARARKYLNSIIDDGTLIVKGIEGIENLKSLDCGAIITCNHFNAYDSFAIQMAYEASGQRGRKFFRIIREGNYTSFPGFFGYLMRNCNTLPLSSNMHTMHEFLKATDTLLQDGHFILIYPEQSMWWNYRKPKPLKEGGFHIAAKNNVPVLPCFITMEDSDKIGEDGFPIQEYTIHISKPIYPDKDKSIRENTADMMNKNYEVWKQIYESVYNTPLTYTTKKAE